MKIKECEIKIRTLEAEKAGLNIDEDQRYDEINKEIMKLKKEAY